MASPKIVPAGLVPLLRVTSEHLPRYASAAGKSTPTYYHVLAHVQGGRIPATRIGARWFINTNDIESIARFLGLLPTPARSTSRSRKVVASASPLA